MPGHRHIALLIFLSSILALTGCNEPVVVTPPKVGEAAPHAELINLNGQKLNLDTLRGKVVVAHFWATWCAPCRKELPSMERLSRQLDPKYFVILGISVDREIKLVEEFKRKYGIRFANHIDTDMTLAKGKFGVNAFPESFIINREGNIVRHMRGEHDWDSQGMIKVLNDTYRGVSTKSGAYW
jgi:peroxiredoxin